MKRILPLALFVALIMLSGCQPGAQNSQPPPQGGSSEAAGPSEPSDPSDADVVRDVGFAVESIAGGTTQAMEFNANTAPKPGYELDLLPGAGFWPVGGDEWSENYSIVEPGGEGAMLVSLLSCPQNPIDHFDLDGEGALEEKLIAYIFTTHDRHVGQQNAVRDFEYTLTVDRFGEREGWQAFHIEFVAPENETRSVRCLSANDDIGADYAAISVRIDLPMDAEEAYDNYMQMLRSIRRK